MLGTLRSRPTGRPVRNLHRRLNWSQERRVQGARADEASALQVASARGLLLPPAARGCFRSWMVYSKLVFESSEYGAPSGSGFEVLIKPEGDEFRYFESENPLDSLTAEEVLARINKRAATPNAATWVLAAVVGVEFFLAVAPVLKISAIVFWLIAAVMLNSRCQRHRRTSLKYQLSESRQEACRILQNSLAMLSTSKGFWRVDPENIAGGRMPAIPGLPDTPFIKTNVTIPGITAWPFALHFLPDQLLYNVRNKYAGIGYDKLHVEIKSVSIVEDASVPADAVIAGTTRKYVKRNGSPDRRYKNNPKLPIARYAHVTLDLDRHKLGFLISNLDSAVAFVAALRNMNSPAAKSEEVAIPRKPDVEEINPPVDRAQWIPGDQPVTIAGFEIPGMIYFGTSLRAVSGFAFEPALIDPSKPVASKSESFNSGSIEHFPNYGGLSSGERHAYLTWHSSGRSTPDAPIGFVFLYFYGLERRLLHDLAKSGSDDEEYNQILTELRRLIDIYGDNYSFLGYATEILEFAEAIRFRPVPDSPPPEFSTVTYDFPARLKIALGMMAQKSTPVPAPWARVWATAVPTFSRRTPYQRCRFYFSELFDARYRERFGDGVILKPNKTSIRLEYRPASPSFDAPITLKPELPDVTILKKPIDDLLLLAEECADQLAAYSRYLGRNPDGEKDLAALALLPPALLSVTLAENVRALRKGLAAQEAKRAILTRKELLNLAGIPETAPFAKRDATALAQILAALGFGIEPDVRFGGPVPSSNTKVCLFHQESNAPTAPTPAYTGASLLVQLAAMVSAADGKVTQQEQEHLETHVANSLDLSHDERHRLQVHLRWVLAERPGLAGVKQRIENLTLSQRQTIGRFLVSIASADGQISPDEVEMLGKTYRILGLNPQDVYSDVHKAATEPITIKSAEASVHGFKLPARQIPVQTPGLQLDAEAIQNKLKETAAVSALLASVFADETTSAPSPGIPAFESQSASFMRVIATKAMWSRAELQSIALDRAILLDGTIEAINETAFESCDEPAMEGDDPIEVNITVLTKLIERSVSA